MPSLDYQVGAGGNDGFVLIEVGNIYATSGLTYAGMYDGANHAGAWYRFTGVTIPAGGTITSAYIELYEETSEAGNLTKVYGDDQANPTAPSTQADYSGRTRTTAGVDADGDPGAQGYHQINVLTIVQELYASYDYSAGAAMMFLHDDDGSPGTNARRCYTYEQGASVMAAKLHIEYTAAAAAPTMSAATPNHAHQGDTNLDIVITGTDLDTAVSARFFTDSTHATEDTNITVNSTTPDSATQATINITVAAGTVVGYHGIGITNAIGEGFDSGFLFQVQIPTVVPPPPSGILKILTTESTGWRYLTSATDRAHIIEACVASGINVMSFNFDTTVFAKLTEETATVVASIQAFNDAGVDVWALWNSVGGAGVSWDDVVYGQSIHTFVEAVLEWNLANPTAQFTGLDFDLEPADGSSDAQHATHLQTCYATFVTMRAFTSTSGETIAGQGLTVSFNAQIRWSNEPMLTPWEQICSEIDIAVIECYRYSGTWNGVTYGTGIQYNIATNAPLVAKAVDAGCYLVTYLSVNELSMNNESADPVQSRYDWGEEAVDQTITDLQTFYQGSYPSNFLGAMLYYDIDSFVHWHMIRSVTWPAAGTIYNAADTITVSYSTRRRQDRLNNRVFGVQLELRDAAGNVSHTNGIINCQEGVTDARTISHVVPAGLTAGTAALRLTLWAISYTGDSWYDELWYGDYNGAANQATLLAMTMDTLDALVNGPLGVIDGKRREALDGIGFFVLQDTGWESGIAITAATTAPTVTSATPATGNPGDTASSIVIAGDDFTGATAVSFGSGITVNSFSIDSDEQITANITIAAGATLGYRSITVTTAGGTTVGANLFQVVVATVAAPTVTSTSPSSGYQGSTMTVVITGTGFYAGGSSSAVVSLVFGTGVTVSSYTVDSDTQITAVIVIAADCLAFWSPVTVNTTAGAGSGATVFLVLQQGIPAAGDPVEKEWIPTLLPMDRWCEVVGLDPRHFRQVTTTAYTNDTCAAVWKEHSWQHADSLSRDDVARAIQMAEEQFAEHLGFKVLPDWEYQEKQVVPIPGDPSVFNLNARSPRGYASSIRANWGYFIAGGVRSKVLIQEDVAVTYSDVDGDGYKETATVSVATTVTDAQELHIYYPDQEGNDAWEIRYWRKASISGGIATLTFRREQFVLASLIEAFSPEAVDGDDDDNFITTVDVYRIYNDESTQATLIWKPQAQDSCTTCCTETTQTACLQAQNPEMSRLHYQPADWDSTNLEWDATDLEVTRTPDQMELYYRAGYRDMRQTYPLIQMDREMERALVYYSLTLLRRELCGCCNSEGMRNYWTEDLAISGGAAGNRAIAREVQDCPLGTTRAAINAWRLIRRRRLSTPVDY